MRFEDVLQNATPELSPSGNGRGVQLFPASSITGRQPRSEEDIAESNLAEIRQELDRTRDPEIRRVLNRELAANGGQDDPKFNQWYAGHAKRQGLDPNPDAPEHFYDYRAAFKAGAGPDKEGHWPSKFKRTGHPRMVLDGVNTKTGQREGGLTFDSITGPPSKGEIFKGAAGDMFGSFGEPLQGPQGPVTSGLFQPSLEDSQPKDQRFAETQGGAVTGRVQTGAGTPARRSASPKELLGTSLGTAANISDMFTSIPKQVLGTGVYWGARVGTLAKGATPAESAEAAQGAKDWFFPPELSTPMAKLAERFGPEAAQAYYNNPVALVFHGLGSAVEGLAEKGATPTLPKQDWMALADQVMGSVMWRQVRPGVRDAFKRRVEEARDVPNWNAPRDPPQLEGPPGPEPRPNTGGGRGARGMDEPGVYEGEATRITEEPASLPAPRRFEDVQAANAPEAKPKPSQEGQMSDEDLWASIQNLPPAAKALGLGGAIAGAAYLDEDWKTPALGAMFIPVALKHPMTQRAIYLEKVGRPREQVWQETGLFRGKDGIWRREIDDSHSRVLLPQEKLIEGVNDYVRGPQLFKPMKLGEVLEHPTLFRERPELKEMPVRSTGFNFGIAGGFNNELGPMGTMFLGSGRVGEVQSTLLHELQHKIQHDVPRVSTGGNVQEFLPKEFDAEVKAADAEYKLAEKQLETQSGEKYINPYTVLWALKAREKGEATKYHEENLAKFERLPGFESFKQALARREELELVQKEAVSKYKALAGETEARLVEARKGMTAQERRQTPPWEMYDVPEEQQIVRRFAEAFSQSVKEKGGMWHPEAVRALSDSITRASEVIKTYGDMAEDLLLPREKAALASARWSQKAAQAYLNKHMGTEADPLKDTQIPYEGGTKRWEDITDYVITSSAAKYHKKYEVMQREDFATYAAYDSKGKQVSPTFNSMDQANDWLAIRKSDPAFEKVPDEERVWEVPEYEDTRFGRPFGSEKYKAALALREYLAHVGDYLEQNVPAEKLPQYDLVRAVKETAKRDAEVAKEMEKAALDSSNNLPVHKAYPDGFKWVEMRVPEKLTEAQAKTVRPITVEEWVRDLPTEEVGVYSKEQQQALYAEDVRRGRVPWVTVGADGKRLYNNYTKDFVLSGKTPEEAWLAGEMAREGNQMGHCVGGYCEGVIRGEERIYSLRDPKGRSHVTVEVVENTNRDPLDFWHTQSKEFQAKYPHPKVSLRNGEHGGLTRDEIIDEWQDWADDLRKTPEWKAIRDVAQIKGKQNLAPVEEYKKYVQDFVREGKWGEVGDLENTGLKQLIGNLPEKAFAEKLFPGQRYLTDSEWRQAFDAYLQEGKNGGSGAVPPRGRGGNLGGREQGKADLTALKYLTLGGLGALIGAYAADDDPLKGAIVGTGLGIFGPAIIKSRGGQESLKLADSFLGMLSTRLRNVAPGLHGRAVRLEGETLRESHAILRVTEPFFKGLDKDSTPLGASIKADIMKGDFAAANLKLRAHPDPTLRGEWQNIATAQRGLGRRFILQDVIQSGLAKTPQDVWGMYVARAVEDMERDSFFGAARKGGDRINLDGSINALVQMEAIKNPSLTEAQLNEMRTVLHTRFDPQKPMYGILQDMRNLSNAGLLGNILSSFVQLQDTMMAAYHQDLRSAVRSVVQNLTGSNRVSVHDFGLADHIAEELMSTRKTGWAGGSKVKAAGITAAGAAVGAYLNDDEKFTGAALGGVAALAMAMGSAKFLNKMFKWSGFSLVDRFGKNVNLNAALNRFERYSDTPSGQAKIMKEFGPMFEGNAPDLITDLQARKGMQSEHVRTLLFSELSDAQPISRMELPEVYHKMPNGRMAYQLHTFMMKQMDIVRRDIYQQIKSGNRREGIANLLKFATIVGISGATVDQVKNWMQGRDEPVSLGGVLENVLKTFGYSEYVRDKANKKTLQTIIETTGGTVYPPVQMMDVIIKGDEKAAQYIPQIGRLYENHFLGGRERWEKWREKKQKAAQK